ncbi:MAG: hypothetical protein LBK13_03025 [Spirochaetales bacterium]|jgi:hypothetical protein|nr:hypothetical protein [Spirochaetales bacterium]
MEDRKEKTIINDTRYVQIVTIGGIDPNSPLTDEKQRAQVELLNKLLSGYPRGTIIGKDTAIGRYMLGEHELCMQKTSYHVAFARKPEGINEFGQNIPG